MEEEKYINGYCNYTGSKFKLLSNILPKFDYNKKIFIDLFCGSFVVGANVADKYDIIIGNDIISDLINIHQSLIDNNNIVDSVKKLCPGRNNPDGYAILRNSYNENNTPDKLWALMLSCQNNLMRFNNSFKFNQTYGNRGFSDNTQKKIDIWTDHIRKFKSKISFTSSRFENVEILPNSMVYIDPPYSNTSAGYNCYWKKDDDDKLYNYIKNINDMDCSFMISGSIIHNGVESELLKRLIEDGYKYEYLEFDYNKVSRIGKKETKEIIIMNY